jgi:acyl carrier protein
MMGESTNRAESEVESAVAAIWAEVLNVDTVSPDANFFDLGGHSLLAIRVMSRIQARLVVDLPLASLFQHPTLRDFATAVGDALDWVVPTANDRTLPPPIPERPADLEQLLAALDDLSDDDAAALLEKLESDPSFGS